MLFDQFIQYRALHHKFSDFESADLILSNLDNVSKLPLKQVCTQITIPLFDDLEYVCGVLEVSKRRFVEIAIDEAINRAKVIMEQAGIYPERVEVPQ